MIIKVCGMRDADNIRDVARLGIDWLGLVFCANSPRFVRQISSHAGMIPDYGSFNQHLKLDEMQTFPYRNIRMCGVFADDMPQNIVTRVVNYHLDLVQLDGRESPVMIDNLRRTLDPDIRSGIQIVKTLTLSSRTDLHKYKDYAGIADYLLFDIPSAGTEESSRLFDWNILNDYDGEVPFLVGGNIGWEDIRFIRSITHPRWAGVNVSSRFETEPAVKDVERLGAFVKALRT